MKKFSILIIVIVFCVFSSFSFTQEILSNVTQDVEKIEINDYYWYLSLLVDLHSEIGRWEVSDKQMFFAVGLINDLKYYSNLDIIEYLWHSFDVQRTLDFLLWNIFEVLTQSEFTMHYINNNLMLLKAKKTDCDSLKDISDKNFVLALKDLDIQNMEINFGFLYLASRLRFFFVNYQANRWSFRSNFFLIDGMINIYIFKIYFSRPPKNW